MSDTILILILTIGNISGVITFVILNREAHEERGRAKAAKKKAEELATRNIALAQQVTEAHEQIGRLRDTIEVYQRGGAYRSFG